MKNGVGLIVFIMSMILPFAAQAGAWPQAKSDTQIIISYEPGRADDSFDSSGGKTIPLDGWKSNEASFYIDHGVTDRLSLTAKVNYRDYVTDMERFSGLSSVEIGGRWALHRDDNSVFALGATVEGLGKGHRTDFDISAKGGTDYDLRVYAGKNFKFLGRAAFMDLQAARHLRQYEANQWRLEATLGVRTAPKWMVMAQVFAGRTDKESWGYTSWNKTELSLVRSFGPQQKTSLQVGLRQTVSGRNIPTVNAMVVSLWKTF